MTLTPYDYEAIRRIASSCSTRHPTDLAAQALLIRSARNDREREVIIAEILHHRRNWLKYLTVSQRRWQQDTRKPSKARHHDSIAIREKYVTGRGR